MKGLPKKWPNLPNYILGITKEIWEDRGIGKLNHYYTKNIPVRTPGGISIGNQNVINSTLATLSEFPDRQLLGEDVIWSGDTENGFLSSHRLLTTGTHTGTGYFGEKTDKKFAVRAIADCSVINDQINDEWLIRDNTAIVKQLGMDPKQFARDLITREGGKNGCIEPFVPSNDVRGPYNGKGNKNKWGEKLAKILKTIMNKDYSIIRTEYDRAAQAEHPGAVTVHSWADIEALWMGLRSSFPNAVFSIEHQIGREDPLLPPRAAIRWSLMGRHEGWGMFDMPTGVEIYVMGATHAEFGPYGLRREFTLFDPVSIWKQIFMKIDLERKKYAPN